MSSKPVDILIAGGGPVGLSLAVFATKLGLSVRVIEKEDSVHREGRADLLNSRTLESYEQASPHLSNAIPEPALKYAKVCNYKQGQLVSQNIWDIRHCKFDYTTFTPQYLLEHCLINHLSSMGVEIERSKTLINFEVTEDDNVAPVRAIVKHTHTGEEELIFASYMAGCEGGRSFTRRKLGIPLIGGMAEMSFYIMDNSYNKIEIPSKDVMSVLQSDLGMMIVLPTGKNHYRTVLQLKGETPGQQSLTEEEALAFAKKLASPFEIEFGDIHWLSYFTIKELVAEEYSYNNRIFLAGDACHMHSPAGGLGLNTGVSDVYDLAWKIYFVKHGLVDRTFLELYHKERHDIAEKVIAISGLIVRLHAQIANKKSSPTGQNSSIQKELAYAWARNNEFITGLGTEYVPTPLSIRDSIETLAFSEPFNVLAGRRFPDTKVILLSETFKDARFLYDYWTYAATFRIIIFPGNLSVTASTLDSFAEYLELPTAFPQKYISPTSIPLFETFTILYDQETTLPLVGLKGSVFLDASKEEGLYSVLGINPKQGAIFVVRPDNIIGCSVPMNDFQDLEIYFRGFLISEN